MGLLSPELAQQLRPNLLTLRGPKPQRNTYTIKPLDYVELVNESKPQEGNTMNTNNDTTNTNNTPPKSSLLSPTAKKYLVIAIDKLTEPVHPNFRAKASEKSLQSYQTMQLIAAKAYDQSTDKSNPVPAIITAGKGLAKDVQLYTQFFKTLASNAAFQANLDHIRLMRETNNVDRSRIDGDLSAMDEAALTGETEDTVFDDNTHALDLNDIPLADAPAMDASTQEPYEGGDKPVIIATSLDDCEDAIDRIQTWLGLAFASFDAKKLEYWGITTPFPLTQRVVEDPRVGKRYIPITTFDEYRTWSLETFKERNRVVPKADNTLDLMASA